MFISAVQKFMMYEQVSVELYSSGQRQMYLTFDAVGTDKVNWFSLGKLMDSNFQDLFHFRHEFFSLVG